MLEVTVKGATISNYSDDIMDRKMNPFIQIINQATGKKVRTKTAKSMSGLTPHWNETFKLQLRSIDDRISIKCYDEEFVFSGLLCELIVTVDDIMGGNRELYGKWLFLQSQDNEENRAGVMFDFRML